MRTAPRRIILAAYRDTDPRGLADQQSLPSTGAAAPPDLSACDREPIHVPGAIQPHGLLLIADRTTRTVKGGAGDLEGRLTPLWLGRPLDELLAQDVARAITRCEPGTALRLALVPGRSETFQAFAAIADDALVVTLEPAPEQLPTPADFLSLLDNAAMTFERAADLTALCTRAAIAFRQITGFDRVMIYRFLDDGAGVVVGEDRAASLPSFLHHYFPAGDIPRQARALYVRNRVRVIPDIHYTPAPIRPEQEASVDLSDVSIRSVSPIHIQYLRNMGVGASASISIVKDGLLWGLVACHHNTPRDLPYETRLACSALAGSLARQIRAKEEAEVYRERIRLRAGEDQVLAEIDREEVGGILSRRLAGELRAMLAADGFAIFSGGDSVSDGICPDPAALKALARWLEPRVAEPFVSRSLAAVYPPAEAWADRASGVLALSVAAETPMVLAWFRVEQPELVEWAGNPHKESAADPGALLTPRNSFESWREEVRLRARPWSLAQIETAVRLRRRLFEVHQSRRLRELNRQLTATIADKEVLLQQKDHLLREVNHRVQNSLQLVQSFLALQSRVEPEGHAAETLREAQRRISAVALVHRRLYQADQLDTIDLARYLEELVGELREAMGVEWAAGLTLDLAPVLVSADRAVHVGLILTELVINANKYAYGGASGPIAIALEEYRSSFRLIVADQGKGLSGDRQGFGSRMMKAMVQRLDGTLERFDNKPGLRVIVSAPVEG